MNPVAFAASYLVSWLLMGFGVFLALRFVLDLRKNIKTGKAGVAAVGLGMRLALVALVSLASLGIVYAGAYTFYNLMTGTP